MRRVTRSSKTGCQSRADSGARPHGLQTEASVPFISPKTTKYPDTVKHAVEAVEPEVVGTQFLTRSEVSRLLGVSPNTVTRWARVGQLPCHVTLGGHHRFERDLIEALQKELTRGAGRIG